MNEEHTSIAPSAEQAENERDARAEELQSTFSYDGYQVVRKELFAHLRDPAIVAVMKTTRMLCAGALQSRISVRAGR